jgi:DNA-binding IclR family transcriptional regulator
MVFPAHRVTGGLLMLAELEDQELDDVYAEARYVDRAGERPDLARLKRELATIRRKGFAVNQDRSERGVVAIGVPVRNDDGTAKAGLSISMPSVRYDRAALPHVVSTLQHAAHALETDLRDRD